MQSVAPDIGQSSLVVTQKYPSSSVSRSSCLDLAVFDAGCSGSVTTDSPVSAVDVDQGVVDSPELGEVVTFRHVHNNELVTPLNPRMSPASMLSVPQIVVESLTSYEAPVSSKDVCPAADRVVPLLTHESEVSLLSSVQLSPNRVRADYDFDTMDVFPMYAVSSRNNGYFLSMSPISPPKLGSPVTPATGSLMNEATGSGAR